MRAADNSQHQLPLPGRGLQRLWGGAGGNPAGPTGGGACARRGVALADLAGARVHGPKHTSSALASSTIKPLHLPPPNHHTHSFTLPHALACTYMHIHTHTHEIARKRAHTHLCRSCTWCAPAVRPTTWRCGWPAPRRRTPPAGCRCTLRSWGARTTATCSPSSTARPTRTKTRAARAGRRTCTCCHTPTPTGACTWTAGWPRAEPSRPHVLRAACCTPSSQSRCSAAPARCAVRAWRSSRRA